MFLFLNSSLRFLISMVAFQRFTDEDINMLDAIFASNADETCERGKNTLCNIDGG